MRIYYACALVLLEAKKRSSPLFGKGVLPERARGSNLIPTYVTFMGRLCPKGNQPLLNPISFIMSEFIFFLFVPMPNHVLYAPYYKLQKHFVPSFDVPVDKCFLVRAAVVKRSINWTLD